MAGVWDKIDGKLTPLSAVIIAVVVLLNALGLIKGTNAGITKDDVRQVATEILAPVVSDFTAKHVAALETQRQVIAELRLLSDNNKEMVLILRDLKEADRRTRP